MGRTLTAALAVACVTATRAGALDVPTLGVFEQSFAHTGSYTNPYAEVTTATVTFTRPGGGTETIPLFWDGGTAWKVRFSPDATGGWSWQVTSTDAGLEGQTGSFNCVASTNKGGIRASASYPYHFERQDGTPFYWFGDTMWRCGETCPSENLDRTALYHYIDVRAGQGFNYVHSNMGRWSSLVLDGGGNEGGTIWAGALGNEVNPGYFQELDTRIVYMNSKGITVGYLLGWAEDLDDFGETKRLRYARYVAARYGAYDVVFIVSGEYDKKMTAADYRKIGQEIFATDPHDRMIGIHALDTVELFADESWMSFGDYQQLYTSLHGNILGARDHNKPVVNSEYAYYLRDQSGDGTVDKPNSATLEQIRNATYDIVMAGGYIVTGWGTTYFGGARDPGKFNVEDPRNDDWEDDVQHVKTLFTGLQWWKLQPQDGLLTGAGTRYCLAETGQQYVAYVRGNGGTNSLSLGGAASASYSFRRFDPRDGSYTPLADYTGTGPVTLDPPDSQDWVFVLENKPGPQTPVTVEFGPEADTYVDERYPASNLGGDAEVAVGGPTATREMHIRFNVDIPAGATVTDARLVLVATNSSVESGGTIRLFAPTVEQWDEMTPTWNSPLGGSDASGDLAALGPVSVGSTCEFTGLEAALTQAGRYTFVIRSSAADGAAYRSKEYATASERPILRVTYVVDPTDTDGDGMKDDWELAYFGDLSHDGTADGDADGLTDVQEFQHSTDPTDADTDDDGVSDGDEVAAGTDPTRAPSGEKKGCAAGAGGAVAALLGAGLLLCMCRRSPSA